MSKYIKNKGYSVRYDLYSLLLCYDYFNHGIVLPKYFDFIFTRKILHFVLRFIIITAYIFRLYRLFYRVIELDDNAIVIFKGKGKWANTVKLIQDKSGLKIIKIPYDKKSFLREKKFYETYKDSNSILKLPNCTFRDGLIEIEFLGVKSFQRQINDGSINREGALNHFKKIQNVFSDFYNKSFSLVHADMSPENIFIKNNTYYLIDFADSHINKPVYDLYILIRSILFSFNNENVNTDIRNYSLSYNNISRILGIDITDVIKLEQHFQKLDIEKHPEHILAIKENASGMHATSLRNTNNLFDL